MLVNVRYPYSIGLFFARSNAGQLDGPLLLRQFTGCLLFVPLLLEIRVLVLFISLTALHVNNGLG
jgi:hypothetical protein